MQIFQAYLVFQMLDIYEITLTLTDYFDWFFFRFYFQFVIETTLGELLVGDCEHILPFNH